MGHTIDRIEIPAEALRVKDWFHEFPSDDIVKEIREFVAETAKPYLWRGHTHNPPPIGSLPIYVEEFSLPPRCKPRSTWSPCPCCTPDTPKFKNEAKIAWFPKEAVIRLIGPDCYKTLDAGGHADALIDLRRRQRERRDTEYLIAQIPRIASLKEALLSSIPIAQAADEFFPALRNRIEVVLNVRLWNAIRTGELHVEEERIEHYRNAKGEEGQRTVTATRRHAVIAGIEGLSPDRKAKSPKLERIVERTVGCDVDISQLAGEQLRKLANKVARIFSDTNVVFNELEAELRFLRQENFQTLQYWASLPNAPVSLMIERENDAVIVGTKVNERVRVAYSQSLMLALPSVPQLAIEGS